MKSTLLVTALFSLALLISGCGNADEKALETSAPPTSDNANTFEAGGGQPKEVGERGPEGTDGPQGPAEKPAGY